MKLKMKLDGRLIDAVTVEKAYCRDEEHIERLKDLLRLKYQSLMKELKKQPVFYLYIASNDPMC